MPGFDVPGNRHADGLRNHLLAHHYFASRDDIAVQLTSSLTRCTDDTHQWQMFKCNQNAVAL